MPLRAPRGLNRDLTAQVPAMLETLRMLRPGVELPPLPRIVVCDTRYGFAKWKAPFPGAEPKARDMIVNLPQWAFVATGRDRLKREIDANLHIWCLAHELAHIANYLEYGRKQDNHGPNFYRHFKRICPPELWHYERNAYDLFALRAGISRDVQANCQQDVRRHA